MPSNDQWKEIRLAAEGVAAQIADLFALSQACLLSIFVPQNVRPAYERGGERGGAPIVPPIVAIRPCCWVPLSPGLRRCGGTTHNACHRPRAPQCPATFLSHAFLGLKVPSVPYEHTCSLAENVTPYNSSLPKFIIVILNVVVFVVIIACNIYYRRQGPRVNNRTIKIAERST